MAQAATGDHVPMADLEGEQTKPKGKSLLIVTSETEQMDREIETISISDDEEETDQEG